MIPETCTSERISPIYEVVFGSRPKIAKVKDSAEIPPDWQNATDELSFVQVGFQEICGLQTYVK